MSLANQDISDADIILIDGKNTMWRAAHAQKNLSYKNGEGDRVLVGAVYGFFQSVLSVAHMAPDATVIICWEGSRRNRQLIVPDYKANRDNPSEEVISMRQEVARQEEMLRDILEHTSWVQARSLEWEADDVMATLAAAGRRGGSNVLIYTNDFDLMQCLVGGIEEDDGTFHEAPWVRQYSVVRRKGAMQPPVWTEERLIEERGLEPWQVPHLKALAGDTSDGYKGVPGVGDKTVLGWLSKFDDLDGIIDAIDRGDVAGKKAQDVLKYVADARACYEVAVTQANVPVKFVDGEPDKNKLRELLMGFRFQSLTQARTLSRMTR